MPIPIGFPRLIAELERLYLPPFGAKATFRKIRQALEELARFGRISRVDRISPDVLAAWLTTPEIARRSRATRRTLLSSLRRACSYAVGRGYLRESPFKFRSLADWLGREELDESLEPEPKKSKHKSIEDLAGPLADWLAVAAEIGPWAFPGPTGVGPWIHGAHGYRALDKIKAVGIRAGVPGMTLQSLRHSFITHSTRWGIASEDVRKLAGHTSERTTQGYRGYDRDDMRAAAERIHFASSQGGSINAEAG